MWSQLKYLDLVLNIWSAALCFPFVNLNSQGLIRMLLCYCLWSRGIRGDLLLVVSVNGKDGIQREGCNLYSKISIDYTEAILGAVIKVGSPVDVMQVFN